MHTELTQAHSRETGAQRAKAIIGSCVHCGFCLATCPTYQVLGSELDSPRGRIYLIKQMLEGAPASRVTATHLDRCLTCRACETTCPSGVQYGELVDIGREMVDAQPIRGAGEDGSLRRHRSQSPCRTAARLPQRCASASGCQCPLLPRTLSGRIPARARATPTPLRASRAAACSFCKAACSRALAPNINAAATRVLDAARYIPHHGQGGRPACGALGHHLSATRTCARPGTPATSMPGRRCWIAGVEAIVMSCERLRGDGEGLLPPARAGIPITPRAPSA